MKLETPTILPGYRLAFFLYMRYCKKGPKADLNTFQPEEPWVKAEMVMRYMTISETMRTDGETGRITLKKPKQLFPNTHVLTFPSITPTRSLFIITQKPYS